MITVALLSQAVGFALLLVVLPFTPSHAVASDYLFGALAGLCGGLAITLLYHALSIGKMGIVSPITAVLAAALPLVYGTIRGDRLTMLQILGLLLALIAIVMISLSLEDSGKREIVTAVPEKQSQQGSSSGVFSSCSPTRIRPQVCTICSLHASRRLHSCWLPRLQRAPGSFRACGFAAHCRLRRARHDCQYSLCCGDLRREV